MDRIVAYRGERYTIAFAWEKNGNCPGAEFFQVLSTLDKAKLMALFKIAADLGQFNNPQKFGELGNGLREFKSHQIRMPYAFAANQRGLILITHGFKKKRQKAPPEEIRRARRILAEDQNRPGLEIIRKAKQ